MKFEKGDLVTHKCSPGNTKAVFLSYKSSHPSEEDKVFVEYTEGHHKGREGEWLEKYCVSQYKDKNVSRTETGGFEIKCGHISEPVAGGKIKFGKKVEYPDDFKPTHPAEGSFAQRAMEEPITPRRAEQLRKIKECRADIKLTPEQEAATQMLRDEPIYGTKGYLEPGTYARSDLTVAEVSAQLDKLAIEQDKMQSQLRNNVAMSSRGSGAEAMHAAYSKMIANRFRGHSITGRRAEYVVYDEVKDGPHMEIQDESSKTDWYKKMYSCDFSELENRVMANMAPKHKYGKTNHDDMMDALSSMFLGSQTKPTKETPMKETITEIYTDGVLTQTLIGDQDVETMSASDMLQAIGNVNGALEKLNKHDMSSSYVAKRAKKLTDFVKSVYSILDNKFSDE